jgi:hypothetical protein
MTMDGLLTRMDWSNPAFTSTLQIADAVLIATYTLVQIYPLALVRFVLRKRLDASRRAELDRYAHTSSSCALQTAGISTHLSEPASTAFNHSNDLAYVDIITSPFSGSDGSLSAAARAD